MLKTTRFTSSKNAHAHLLKHVVRLVDLQVPARESDEDSERWDELITDPPLARALSARRARVMAVLRAVRGCPAGAAAPTSGRPCDSCQDAGVQHVVSHDMRDVLSGYLAAARGAIDAAFASPDRHGPRLVAYSIGAQRTVETVDARHVRVVGRLVRADEVEVVTCYRDWAPLSRQFLELARLRAAHKRAGSLLTV